MILANVSFGIHAFLPTGWLFMATVVILEAAILRWLLQSGLTHRRSYGASAAANVVSGLAGIAVSLTLNGGWWLVVWLPWVSSYEVGPGAYGDLAVYYVAAFVASILIEIPIVMWILQGNDVPISTRCVLRAVVIANAISYLLGSVIMYGYSFS